MKNITYLILVLCVFSEVSGQIVDRVFLRDHREYMVSVIQDVMQTIEERGWYSLTLPEVPLDVNEELLGIEYNGVVRYKNGFLIGIHQIDVLTSSLNQVWQTVDTQVRVDLRGQLRMTEVSIGYDIQADFSDGTRYYTSAIKIPLVTFDFSILYFPTTQQKTVSVSGNHNLASITVDILPRDHTSNALTFLYIANTTLQGVQAWGNTFQTLVEDIVSSNRIPFPGLCYNCATPI